jgi:hypothetical protein
MAGYYACKDDPFFPYDQIKNEEGYGLKDYYRFPPALITPVFL